MRVRAGMSTAAMRTLRVGSGSALADGWLPIMKAAPPAAIASTRPRSIAKRRFRVLSLNSISMVDRLLARLGSRGYQGIRRAVLPRRRRASFMSGMTGEIA